jgi:hypothetical protein
MLIVRFIMAALLCVHTVCATVGTLLTGTASPHWSDRHLRDLRDDVGVRSQLAVARAHDVTNEVGNAEDWTALELATDAAHQAQLARVRRQYPALTRFVHFADGAQSKASMQDQAAPHCVQLFVVRTRATDAELDDPILAAEAVTCIDATRASFAAEGATEGGDRACGGASYLLVHIRAVCNGHAMLVTREDFADVMTARQAGGGDDTALDTQLREEHVRVMRGIQDRAVPTARLPMTEGQGGGLRVVAPTSARSGGSGGVAAEDTATQQTFRLLIGNTCMQITLRNAHLLTEISPDMPLLRRYEAGTCVDAGAQARTWRWLTSCLKPSAPGTDDAAVHGTERNEKLLHGLAAPHALSVCDMQRWQRHRH